VAAVTVAMPTPAVPAVTATTALAFGKVVGDRIFWRRSRL
jgi:hypothetical protein